MATRPQARGGLTGIHYWFMVFVGLWLVSTVLLVILYTEQNTLERQQEEWQKDKSKFVQGNEENTLRTWIDRALSSNQSLAGILNAQRMATVHLIAGDQAEELATAEKSVGDVLDRIVRENQVADASLYTIDNGLSSILNSLYDEYSQRVQQVETLRAENDALKKAELKRLEESQTEKQNFADAASELTGRIETLGKDYDDSLAARQGRIDELTREMSGLREQAEADLNKANQTIDQLDQQSIKLARILLDVRDKQAKLFDPDPAVLIKQMDGQVLESLPAARLAYINLGRRDRVVEGLTFEVYSESGRINADGSGKGTLEVIEVNADTSACRMVRYDIADPIVAGDRIGNVVYDRSRPLRFVALGGFDLNGDGQPDRGGADVMTALVEDWGGKVGDVVNERTDFVILGAEPFRPVLSDDATPEDRERAQEQIARADAYETARDEAVRLAIPLLTQTQFLNLLGFSGSVRGQ